MLTKFIEQYKEIVGLGLMIFGLFMLVFGNKFLKVTFVLIMIIGTTSVALYFYYYFPIDKSKNYSLYITLGIGAIIGLIIGYFLIKITAIIYFAIGGYLGYCLGTMLYAVIFIRINNTWMYPVILVICIPICGYVSYKLSKHLIIITTSLIGAYSIVRGASLYIGHFPNEPVIFELINNHEWDQLKLVKIKIK